LYFAIALKKMQKSKKKITAFFWCGAVPAIILHIGAAGHTTAAPTGAAA